MHPELRGLTIADEPAAWSEAGFTITDGTSLIDGVRLKLTGDPSRAGIVAWTLAGVEAGSIDGLLTDEADPEHRAGDAPAHRNGVTTIDHVVAASPDLPRTIGALAQFGIEPRRTRDTEQGGGALRQVFFRLGRPILELIGPPEATEQGPTSFWGLALTVADLDATRDLLGDRLSQPKEAVQPGRRIATLRHQAVGISVPIAFMST